MHNKISVAILSELQRCNISEKEFIKYIKTLDDQTIIIFHTIDNKLINYEMTKPNCNTSYYKNKNKNNYDTSRLDYGINLNGE